MKERKVPRNPKVKMYFMFLKKALLWRVNPWANRIGGRSTSKMMTSSILA